MPGPWVAGAAALGSTAGLVREEIQFRLPAFSRKAGLVSIHGVA